nr:biotin/lipoyl-binding protein [Sphingobium sp.]
MNMVTKIEQDGQTKDVDLSVSGSRVKRRAAWAAIGILLLGGVAWKFAAQPEAQASAAPIAAVGVAAPLLRAVTQWDDYVGRFAPSQTVEIRPRVSGAVTAIHFRDGDYVRQGQLLFTIDQRPFLAALAEARANSASARSALLLAQSDYARVQRLTGDEAVSASEIDAIRSRLQAAQAALAAAQARERQRTLDVEFT